MLILTIAKWSEQKPAFDLGASPMWEIPPIGDLNMFHKVDRSKVSFMGLGKRIIHHNGHADRHNSNNNHQ